ncbi:MAG: hypothetical protein FD145_728 [Candidatus Saganbacteria bacterium]|uniref:DUF86 domain-containing protein n=1 Tax=Candidatus Saganbacteria bacterium TaxID=2575572 RepID=A0A833NYM2_UNCSA|nr:MAG: hypothetical protein FD145_728 [Candidatus Saganbacteria bacterium]
MTPLKLEQKSSIAARLAFIETELMDLEKYKATTWEVFKENRDIRRNIERITENIANGCIDISKIIFAGEALELPSTYKDVIIQLGINKIIPQKTAEELAKIAALRNILAHEYLDLEWEKIKFFITDGKKTIKEFTGVAQKIIS